MCADMNNSACAKALPETDGLASLVAAVQEFEDIAARLQNVIDHGDKSRSERVADECDALTYSISRLYLTVCVVPDCPKWVELAQQLVDAVSDGAVSRAEALASQLHPSPLPISLCDIVCMALLRVPKVREPGYDEEWERSFCRDLVSASLSYAWPPEYPWKDSVLLMARTLRKKRLPDNVFPILLDSGD